MPIPRARKFEVFNEAQQNESEVEEYNCNNIRPRLRYGQLPYYLPETILYYRADENNNRLDEAIKGARDSITNDGCNGDHIIEGAVYVLRGPYFMQVRLLLFPPSCRVS